MSEDQRIEAEAVERVTPTVQRALDALYAVPSRRAFFRVAQQAAFVIRALDCLRLTAIRRAESAEASTTSLLEEVERWRAIHDEDMTAHRALSVKLAGLEELAAESAKHPSDVKRLRSTIMAMASTAAVARQALSDLPPSPGVESVLAAADANQPNTGDAS